LTRGSRAASRHLDQGLWLTVQKRSVLASGLAFFAGVARALALRPNAAHPSGQVTLNYRQSSRFLPPESNCLSLMGGGVSQEPRAWVYAGFWDHGSWTSHHRAIAGWLNRSQLCSPAGWRIALNQD
jgi:hypothetical protein